MIPSFPNEISFTALASLTTVMTNSEFSAISFGDFAKVKRGDKTIGQIEFTVSRFRNEQWEIENEERH